MGNFLKIIPQELEEKMFEEFADLKKYYQTNDLGPSELNGGRFAEVLLRIFQYLLSGNFSRFEDEIKSFEKTQILNKVENHPTIDIHVRQKVAVLVRLLLDFRNNRDVAHLGGFKPNRIDASFVLLSASWIMAELIRVFGNYSLDKAQEIIDELAVPNYPVIFEIEGDEYISRPDLKASQEVLVLLSKQKRNFDFLFSKTKDKNKSRFTKTISSLIDDKKIAFKDGYYHLLPEGIREIEEGNLLNSTIDKTAQI